VVFLLPITGLVWLIVQIVAKIYVTRKILRGDNTDGYEWAGSFSPRPTAVNEPKIGALEIAGGLPGREFDRWVISTRGLDHQCLSRRKYQY
jgi:hypothetical protein